MHRCLGLAWIGARHRVTVVFDEAQSGLMPRGPGCSPLLAPQCGAGRSTSDLARACAQAEGARDGEAIGHLDAADRLAPQYVRPDPMARELVAELDRRARRGIWELDSLRNRFGIGEPGTRRMPK